MPAKIQEPGSPRNWLGAGRGSRGVGGEGRSTTRHAFAGPRGWAPSGRATSAAAERERVERPLPPPHPATHDWSPAVVGITDNLTAMNPVVELRAASKRFGQVEALQGVISRSARRAGAMLAPTGRKDHVNQSDARPAAPDRREARLFGFDPRTSAREAAAASCSRSRARRRADGQELVNLFRSYYRRRCRPPRRSRGPGSTQGGARAGTLSGGEASGFTSRSPSAAIPKRSFSTSRPSAWTWRAAARRSTASARSPPPARRSCSPPTISRRRTSWRGVLS